MAGSGISLDTVGPDGAMRSANRLRLDLCGIVGISTDRTLQQAYSLLDDQDVKSQITNHYKTITVGKTAATICEIPWRRIYTLNVDNSLAHYANTVCNDRLLDRNRVQVINYNDDYRDPNPETVMSIVHLHGSVTRPEDGYVFSQSEYAKNVSRPNSWMSTLTQLLRSEPFIVAGTTLEESDVTYYLEQRPTGNHVFMPEVPSILIEPYPDRLTERLCENHDFILFEGTAIEFFDTLSAEFANFVSPFAPSSPTNITPSILNERDRIRFDETFEQVPVDVPATDGTAKLLLGVEPTWSMLAGNSDIRRDAFSVLDSRINMSASAGVNFVIVLDDPGSGKSALLRRMALHYARKHANVFYFRGREHVEDHIAGDYFSSLKGHVYLFSDNIADCTSFLLGILHNVALDKITIVGCERKYRARYIEDALGDFDHYIIDSKLDLSRAEAGRLVRKHMSVGLSDIDTTTEKAINKAVSSIAADPISIATCRIQNNFFAFDKIVKGLIEGSTDSELRFYAAVGVARYCYAGGVSKDILSSMPSLSRKHSIGDLYSKFPVQYAPGSRDLVVPARTSVSERVVEVLKERHQEILEDVITEMATELATRVTRAEIAKRTPASKLAGGLLDFDRVVQKFIDNKAEHFYEAIKDVWSWNSRYWEQLSLLKLDRYFQSRNDEALLQEAIQNARYAYSIERHPLSLTTLAKALFSAVEAGLGDRDTIFAEAFGMISQSIDIEKGWDRLRSTAFFVCFRGVKQFTGLGGVLTGQQSDDLRDIIAITHARKLRDRKMIELREEVLELLR
jgi:hypothetical protein